MQKFLWFNSSIDSSWDSLSISSPSSSSSYKEVLKGLKDWFPFFSKKNLENLLMNFCTKKILNEISLKSILKNYLQL